jgi:hypothetical protein
MIELEKLAYAASAAPFVAGLADVGEKTAERFRVVAERWRVGDNEKQKIEEVINAPLKGGRPYETLRKLSESGNLPEPLVKLKEALDRVGDEVEKDAAVVAVLVLYKTLINNAKAYGEWAELYKWARSLVEKQEFTVSAGDIKRLQEAHRRLEGVAGKMLEELNRVLELYSQSGFYKERPHLLNKLKQLLKVDFGMAEELAMARVDEFSVFRDINMGSKAYAALLSVAKGGIYGHAATLFMVEGALADIVLPTPGGAYEKARYIAKGRGETVDPSYSGRRGRSVDRPSWEDRAASVLLRYLLGRAVSEDLVFRRVEGGFEVFRAYGGVEARVDVLKIGESAVRSKADEEELRRFVEEAKKTAPDLSGLDKAPQYLEWRTTDVTTTGGWIEAVTAHPWQLRWYFGLLGEEESFHGSASVTKEGIKHIVTAFWSREREDQILRESWWLESLLGQQVESWRELVDAINWSWVLERVEELAGALKPWIGPKSADAEKREGLVRRMLGELALLAHFAEARRGMDDDKWREERAVRLAKAVEALSGGRIEGNHANELAELIIRYAESRREYVENSINVFAGKLADVFKEDVERVKGEVWGVVDFILSNMYCLARDCARDAVVRKFVAPALELVMLDKARNNEFDKERALLWFGEMYATAIAGDGTVGPREVVLTVGGELGGGAALLRLATLHLLNQLLPEELKFGVRVYVGEGIHRMAATGEGAAKFMRLLAVSAPSAGGEYLSEKFEEFMEAARVEVRVDNIRRTDKGHVAADLTLSEANIAIKYNVYLHDKAIELEFQSTDRSRVELAARLLRHAGVNVEVKRVKDEDKWYVKAYTDMLAAGHEKLRKALAEIVETARKSVGEEKAKRWLEKLERGRALKEGWPKYLVRLSSSGALEVRFSSTNSGNIEWATQRLREIGLEEGKHFTVKMPENGKAGYVNILKEGLAYAAWLSVNSEGEQQKLAAEFVELILRRAEEADGGMCGKVCEKAEEIVEKGKARGSIKPEGFEERVEVNGKTYVVKVIGGEAVKEKRNSKTLLRIKITAEVGRVEGEHIVDRVVREYTITYSRRGGDNAAVAYAYAEVDDAERLAAVVEALTGKKPRIRRMKDGNIMIVCGSEHLEGFKRFAELADAIEKWLEETRR